VTVCPTGEGIAIGIDYRDEEGKQSDSNQEDENEDSSSHASEGSLMGCKVLLTRTAQ